MIIKHLKLINFRNYENLDINFFPKINIIYGKNAQGKTNLLESLIYLSLTRSHRLHNDRKLIRDNCDFADIKCVYEDEYEKEIEAIIHKEGKTLKVRKQPVKKSSEFIGLLNVVLFSPDDLVIFSDSPSSRRRLVNQEITKVSSLYLNELNDYQKLLKDRNVLLKSNNIDSYLIDVIDEKMSIDECTILSLRKEFVDIINEYINDFYNKISGEDNIVRIKYKTFVDLDKEFTKEYINEVHKSYRSKDLDYRVSNSGIHRDDFIFYLNDKSVIEMASQGQKRMIMLAFKLSLLKYIERKINKKPVLLLDDVLSELDIYRQECLYNIVKNDYQCFISTTFIPSFIEEEEGIFQIEDGRLIGGRL